MGDTAPSAALEFTFPDTSSTIRTITIDGEPWFNSVDVCGVLGIASCRAAVGRLASDEKVDHAVDSNDTLIIKYISESGLYRLVFTSRVEAAERFRMWVAREVIPNFRRAGNFQIPSSFPEALRMAALAIEERDQARQEAAQATAAVARVERQVDAIAPSAGSWDHLPAGRGTWDSGYALRILRRDPNLKKLDRDQYRVSLFRVGIANWDQVRKVFHLRPEAVASGLATGSDTTVRITPKGLALVHADLGGSKPLGLNWTEEILEGELVDHRGHVIP